MKLRTNISFIRHLVAKAYLTDYCYWLKFKYIQGNSCYFRYTINSIAKQNSISHNCAKKYISCFLRRGWCKEHAGNLVFVKLQDLFTSEGLSFKSTFNIQSEVSDIRSLKIYLQKVIFEDTLRKQAFIIEKKQDLNNPRNLKQYKAAVRAGSKYASLTSTGAIVSDYIMTNNWMASIFNFSKASAQRLKEIFQSNGWFSFIKRFSTIAHSVSSKAFKTGILPIATRNLFLYKGYVMRCEPSLVLIHK